MLTKPELIANYKNRIREKMSYLLERTKKFEFETYVAPKQDEPTPKKPRSHSKLSSSS